jgi:glycine/D-amino acid oxidase-like deaminating enzyme
MQMSARPNRSDSPIGGSTPPVDVAVIGAGVIGLACAVALQQAGRRVTLFDHRGVAGGASFGTAGLINGDAHLPMAMPGMIWSVPRWLRDPYGPVRLRPAYALRALPWLLRWLWASREAQVRRAVPALHALYRDTFAGYRTLLGAADHARLLHRSGGVVLPREARPGADERLANRLREELGIGCEVLTRARLRELFPGIAPFADRGLLFPNNGYTLAPARLVAALHDRFCENGGELRREQVLKLLPQGDGGMLLTSAANTRAAAVVVAGGAWSRALLDPLGLRIPLETERGYHLQLGVPSTKIEIPIIYKARGVAITPMAEGLRLAGTVEIAGLDAPPDERRALTLRRHLDELFPGIEAETRRVWMGHRSSLPDSIALIDRMPRFPWLYAALGHGHDGMIGAPGTARLIAAMITGTKPFIDPAPYAMRRFVRG